MDTFEAFLEKIESPVNRKKIEDILKWVLEKYPDLEPVIKWNQPMFATHGTYIIGFSVSKKHISVSPEVAGMKKFSDEIKAAGYSQTDNIFRIGWDQPVEYELLGKTIDFNLIDKADATTFWR